MPRLLSRRDWLVWLGAFALVSAVIIATGFESHDPDSALYAGLADRLSREPVHRWLAPEWWDFWPEAQMTGWFREHPAGVLLLPMAMTRVGIPAVQGAYVVGIAAGLASLLMMAAVIQATTSRLEARAALVLLQVMPVAFIFRIRANHEYPMLACLLMAVLGLMAAGRGRLVAGALLAAAGLTLGLFVKGVFVITILLALAVWIAINPIGEPNARVRMTAVTAVGVIAMAVGGLAYDTAYRAATGEPFWSAYWQRQIGPLMNAGVLDTVLTLGRNVFFYVSRLVWHPAPWSLALGIALWRWRAGASPQLLRPARRGLAFALVFAAVVVVVLSLSSRYAERYAFSATHAIGCAGVVATCRLWAPVSGWVERADRSIAAWPALVWLALMFVRLSAGSLLPRL